MTKKKLTIKAQKPKSAGKPQKAPLKEPNPVGRPRNPKAKTPKILWKHFCKYMKDCNDNSFEIHFTDMGAPHLLSNHTKCPTLHSFCEGIGYEGADALDKLSEANPEFIPIYTRMKERIKDFLCAAGAYGKTNPKMTQFILQCGYGMTPTEKREHSGAIGMIKIDRQSFKDKTPEQTAKDVADAIRGSK